MGLFDLVIYRFSSENKDEFNQYAFLSFGAGNRACIGKRLAMLELKVAIAKTLRMVKFEKGADTPRMVSFST